MDERLLRGAIPMLTACLLAGGPVQASEPARGPKFVVGWQVPTLTGRVAIDASLGMTDSDNTEGATAASYADIAFLPGT